MVQGPRQCGKTTLAQMVCAPEFLPGRAGPGGPTGRGYGYLSFDDDVVRAGAEIDPMGFIADLPGPVVLDEVQRVPGLFTALKLEVDRRRVPGRFVLTGSTNVLAVPTVQDSLARPPGDSPTTPPGPVRAAREPPRRRRIHRHSVWGQLPGQADRAVGKRSWPSGSCRGDIRRPLPGLPGAGAQAGTGATSTPRCSGTSAPCPASADWTPCRGSSPWRRRKPRSCST